MKSLTASEITLRVSAYDQHMAEKIKLDTIMFGTSVGIIKDGEIKHIPLEDIYMSNTTVTIRYSNGSTREFVASDELEKSINEGEMFSVTSMHSDMGIDEEMAVSKMYVGNPLTAMGNMIIMKRNAEMMPEDIEGGEHKGAIIDVLTSCIAFMAEEITSHQSGMSPVTDCDTCSDTAECDGGCVDGCS